MSKCAVGLERSKEGDQRFLKLARIQRVSVCKLEAKFCLFWDWTSRIYTLSWSRGLECQILEWWSRFDLRHLGLLIRLSLPPTLWLTSLRRFLAGAYGRKAYFRSQGCRGSPHLRDRQPSMNLQETAPRPNVIRAVRLSCTSLISQMLVRVVLPSALRAPTVTWVMLVWQIPIFASFPKSIATSHDSHLV